MEYKFITYKGETKTISQWARYFNKDVSTLNNRIKRGWSFEDAIKRPSRNYITYSKTRYKKRLLELQASEQPQIQYDKYEKVHFIGFNNETKSIAQWAKEFNISRQVLANRLRRGWRCNKQISIKV